MPQSLRKSFTAWPQLPALPPTPRKKSLPPRSRSAFSSCASFSTPARSICCATLPTSSKYVLTCMGAILKPPDVETGSLQLFAIEACLDVDEAPPWGKLLGNFFNLHPHEALMRDCDNQRVGARQRFPGDETDAELALGLLGIRFRIVDGDLGAVAHELGGEVGDLGVTHVGAVLLEGEAEHV